MKTIISYLKDEKFVLRMKYFVVFPMLLMTLCSYDGGCDDSNPTSPGCSGKPSPPEPVFNISFTQVDTGKGKFYFTCDQWIVLHSIEVRKDSVYSVETINFQFPYLVIELGNNHLINVYNDVQPGHAWTFTFTGMSKTTGNPFTVSASTLIN
jgi:hypothetical protein